MTTNVPAIQFLPSGIVLPQESDVLTGVLADMNQAFGGGMNKGLTTPQGQLAQSETAIIGDANNTFAYFVNQVDPTNASGFMQDAIARIYFITRKPALPTTVQCECVGAAGTVIPVGSQAQDTQGNIYSSTRAGTIPITGTITLPFANIVDGPIACPSNSLTKIYRAIIGWDKINNSAVGIVGADVESRADFAYRRQQSVALNARGSIQAIYANVFNVADVIDVYATENVNNTVINVGATNYALAPHSLYVAVSGGLAADVAKAIWVKKDSGCDYNGNTSVTVVDDSGYSMPYPSYEVKFQVPGKTPILFAVQIAKSALLPSNIIDLVKAAIVAAFNGADGGTRARIGSTILASRYYAPVSKIGTSVSILSILIGTSTPTLNSVLMGIDQAPTINASNISVTLV